MTFGQRSSLIGSVLLSLLAVSACDSSESPGAGQGGSADEGGNGGISGNGGGGVPSGAGTSGDLGDTGGGAGANGALDVSLVIDDFEDGDGAPLLGGGWYVYDDNENGGGSTLTISRDDDDQITMTGEGFESDRSLFAEFTFDQGELTYDPYVGIGAWLAGADSPVDWSSYGGIAYTYRGSAHSLRVETYDVGDYDYYSFAVAASDTWTTIEIPFTNLTQEGWGVPVTFDASNIGAVSFHVRGRTGTAESLAIDDLSVLGVAGDETPNMEILEPAPPEDDEIGSVQIDNTLQAMAMEHLDRGYNLAGWLEAGRFESFDYDEEFVANLAAAGFKSLRLPIDFDLYIEERSGAGTDTELVLHDDLFAILDSFDAWTEAHGLSFTIDYHQYDESFAFDSEQSIAEAVELWSRVAEHFADSPREDVFFELLNEPELSAAGVIPTDEQWTDIAEQMIAAIRQYDDVHTIIFGGTDWYGITPLSQREPLSDDNVVYAFHFYDPFIFTHQGASWANMASTHDIPYPYDPERWSEYYSDLGFNASMESWVLSQARTYYKTGNRATMRNRILEAKRWAVDNNVPVICNEFGVNDSRSRLEDRVRYYTDLTGIFSELQIPWQHWFPIMSADGTVIPEYVEAFGLEG